MFKYRAEITKGEEIRYISHLDYAALIERAFCRSKLPVNYSEGFNPRMKMAFASALAVGVTSDAEYMDFELVKPLCQPEVFERLREALPPGVELLRLCTLEGKHKALMAEVDLAKYDIFVPLAGTFLEAQRAVQDFNAVREFTYERVTPKKKREIEVKQYMKLPITVSSREDGLFMTMAIIIKPSGSIKPGELLRVLRESFGMPVDEQQALIYRRALWGQGKPLIELIEE